MDVESHGKSHPQTLSTTHMQAIHVRHVSKEGRHQKNQFNKFIIRTTLLWEAGHNFTLLLGFKGI